MQAVEMGIRFHVVQIVALFALVEQQSESFIVVALWQTRTSDSEIATDGDVLRIEESPNPAPDVGCGDVADSKLPLAGEEVNSFADGDGSVVL
jgi:hypothetical protein